MENSPPGMVAQILSVALGKIEYPLPGMDCAGTLLGCREY